MSRPADRLGLSVRQVAWRLRWPATTDPSTLREVLHVRLDEGPGGGVGEAAPLPGLHSESLDDVEEALRRLAGLWPSRAADEPPLALAERMGLPLPPSLAWALGWAWRSRTAAPLPAIPASAGLLAGDPAGWAERVAGHPLRRCWKIKVGRADPHHEVRALAELARLHPAREWRLDANRAFTLEDAREFQQRCAPFRPRWIEEPLADPAGLEEWLAGGGWPVALDETLREEQPGALAGRAAAWVLKPQLLGLAACEERFRQAGILRGRPQGGPCCVVSSCFETPLGLAALEALAARAPGRPAPGLGTRDWLEACVTEGPWRSLV